MAHGHCWSGRGPRPLFPACTAVGSQVGLFPGARHEVPETSTTEAGRMGAWRVRPCSTFSPQHSLRPGHCVISSVLPMEIEAQGFLGPRCARTHSWVRGGAGSEARQPRSRAATPLTTAELCLFSWGAGVSPTGSVPPADGAGPLQTLFSAHNRHALSSVSSLVEVSRSPPLRARPWPIDTRRRFVI